MTFTASYAGTCVSCGGRFGAGAEIEGVGGGGFVHAVCPPSAIDRQRPACPTCFLELPASGVCGECS
ncbi:hypothetical protein RB608_11895 [Nocardioides sp. LHD-245]|uniref:hypothetical protein n=1 Tax=Nocardioides sp. LHD-245 TaxID=3051387 RepID=UPI0027E11FA5|nr:hypothetical protein [Nocardioides sp. LHD-245]